MEKGSDTERSKQDQSSPGVLNGSHPPQPVGYETQSEYIDDLPPDSIRPCPYIPDYRKPTESFYPIVVRTPEGNFCIDGWHFVEQAKSADCSTVRCFISQIEQHSDTELAIRKIAIRVMPQGGKCTYAELVRNTCRIYQALTETSDDLVLFTHGGARRGPGFTDSRENNIRVVLANRLGKSPTTINKYLQHGDSINDAAIDALVDAGATKTFFETFQIQKQIGIAALRAEQKDETVIELDISNQVPAWLNEFQQMVALKNTPPPQKDESSATGQSIPNRNRRPTPRQRVLQAGSGRDSGPANDNALTNTGDLSGELNRIGEALIEIADSQERPTPQQVETIRGFILELTVLLQRLTRIGTPEGDGNGGPV